MTRHVAHWTAILVAGAFAVPALSAQDRPRITGLAPGADTNSADVAYQYGVSILKQKPDRAAQAFELAHQLSPDWPEPIYARWVALLLDRRHQLVGYMQGNRRIARSKEIRAIDSLYYRALTLNPFIFRRFDGVLFDEYFEQFVRQLERGGQRYDRGELRMYFDQSLLANHSLRAWLAYSGGRFDEAVLAYGMAIKEAKYKAGLLAARARAAFVKGDRDLALADLTAALQQERKSDEDDDDLVNFYDSKALFEHSVAVVHELAGRRAEAREAYARALQEDLSYHQAHVRLAALAIQDGDSATAISEYDLAVQLRADDAVSRLRLGELLVAAGRPADAIEHLKAATSAAPFFATSYHVLGRAYDALAQPTEAMAQYQAFVARASRNHPDLPTSLARLAAARDGRQP